MHHLKTIATAAIATLALAGTPIAAEFEVRMLNRGEAGLMVFEPALVQIQPGDTVHFVSTDAGHNAETINTLIPEGAEPFKGGMGDDVSVTFEVAGAYAIKCLPHLAMGMVAAIVVGEDPTNLADFKDTGLPRKAQERLDAAIAGL